MTRLRTVSDVVAWRMCVGCGACAPACPEKRVQLMDFFREGIRPHVLPGDCGTCHACVEACPAVAADYSSPARHGPADREQEWGPVESLWEGHATDPQLRFKGSSGGVLTALALYCLEQVGMEGALHIAQDPDRPLRNRTQLSRTPEALVAATGSRYAPASVCDGLDLVEAAARPCVVIGKPAEIVAVAKARKLKPALDRKIGLTLSFFCAETPSTAGTVTLLRQLGYDPDAVEQLRYRGYGWPGNFGAVQRGETAPRRQLTYGESWAILQAFRPWSVHMWPDLSGELADISCGDPWYRQPDGIEPGSSLVLVRTEHGRAILEGAIAAGYVTLRPAAMEKLLGSQRGLLKKKGEILGRRIAARLAGMPVTDLKGIRLRDIWKKFGVREKCRIIFGTLYRIIKRGLYKRQQLDLITAGPTAIPYGERLLSGANDEPCPSRSHPARGAA